jgi:hypothetical protein
MDSPHPLPLFRVSVIRHDSLRRKSSHSLLLSEITYDSEAGAPSRSSKSHYWPETTRMIPLRPISLVLGGLMGQAAGPLEGQVPINARPTRHVVQAEVI